MYDFNIYAKHTQLTIELCINMASAYWNVRENKMSILWEPGIS